VGTCAGEFWQPFKNLVGEIETNVARSDVTQEKLDEACPTCGKPLNIRLGKRGRFVVAVGILSVLIPGILIHRRVKLLKLKHPSLLKDVAARFVNLHYNPSRSLRQVYCCTAYPTCKHMEPLNKPVDTGIECPTCKTARCCNANRVTASCFIHARVILIANTRSGMSPLPNLVRLVIGR